MAEQDSQDEKYRLVTRSDFDGLVCAVLLRENGLVDHVAFAHPKDMQDGVVSITKRDITTNLPFVPGCHLAFDHHASEAVRMTERANHIIDPNAPSAARVVYDYYGGKETFPTIGDDGLSGHISGGIGGQEQGHARDVLRLTDPAQRGLLLGPRFAHRVVGPRFCEIGRDQAGGDGVGRTGLRSYGYGGAGTTSGCNCSPSTGWR